MSDISRLTNKNQVYRKDNVSCQLLDVLFEADTQIIREKNHLSRLKCCSQIQICFNEDKCMTLPPGKQRYFTCLTFFNFNFRNTYQQGSEL